MKYFMKLALFISAMMTLNYGFISISMEKEFTKSKEKMAYQDGTCTVREKPIQKAKRIEEEKLHQLWLALAIGGWVMVENAYSEGDLNLNAKANDGEERIQDFLDAIEKCHSYDFSTALKIFDYLITKGLDINKQFEHNGQIVSPLEYAKEIMKEDYQHKLIELLEQRGAK